VRIIPSEPFTLQMIADGTVKCCSGDYCGLLVVGAVRVLHSLQGAWGGDTSMWVGSDPCLEGWVGVLCDEGKTRVISLYALNIVLI
jgi:hypothetical protein